jgi:hypothetical protein
MHKDPSSSMSRNSPVPEHCKQTQSPTAETTTSSGGRDWVSVRRRTLGLRQSRGDPLGAVGQVDLRYCEAGQGCQSEHQGFVLGCPD